MKTKKSSLLLLLGLLLMLTVGTVPVMAATSQSIGLDWPYYTEPAYEYDDVHYVYFTLPKAAKVTINIFGLESKSYWGIGDLDVYLDPVSEENPGTSIIRYSDDWRTSNNVTVNLKKGTHRLLIKSDWIKSYSVCVEKIQEYTEGPATKITLTKKVTVTKGMKVSLDPQLVNFYETLTGMKWKTSKKSVATVSSKGVVTAKKAGKATITCTLKNGKKYTCTVTVKDNVYKGKTYSKLNARNYRYGQVWLEPLKISYSGKKLKVECAALNARIFKAKKFDWINFTVYSGDGKVIAKNKFKNVKLNIGKYGKKKITFTYPASKVKQKNYDLRTDTGIYIVYDYWYTYQY